MFLDIAARAEEAFFFAGPQGDADGAARLDVEGGEDAHDFHGDDRACAVVGSAGAGDPAVEVAADHDDLIFQARIGAGDFGDGVVAMLVVAGEFGFDVHFDGDGHVGLKEAVDAAVAFDGHDDGGDFHLVAAGVGSAAHGGAVVVEDGAAGAAAVAGVAGGTDDAGNFFIGEELDKLVGEAHALAHGADTLTDFRAEAIVVIDGVVGDVSELLVGVALEERLLDGGHGAHVAEEHDFAGELALILAKSSSDWMLTKAASAVTGPLVGGTRAWPGR